MLLGSLALTFAQTAAACAMSGFRVPAETIAQSDIFGAGCVDSAGGSGSSHSSYSCKPRLNLADVSQMLVSSDSSDSSAGSS